MKRRTLRKTAKKIGISAPTLSRVLSGKKPDVDSFIKITIWVEKYSEKTKTDTPVDSKVNPKGFTEKEQKIDSLLYELHDAFIELEEEDPAELIEFVSFIRTMQEKLSMRIVRRSYPKGWITYQKD